MSASEAADERHDIDGAPDIGTDPAAWPDAAHGVMPRAEDGRPSPGNGNGNGSGGDRVRTGVAEMRGLASDLQSRRGTHNQRPVSLPRPLSLVELRAVERYSHAVWRANRWFDDPESVVVGVECAGVAASSLPRQ